MCNKYSWYLTYYFLRELIQNVTNVNEPVNQNATIGFNDFRKYALNRFF